MRSLGWVIGLLLLLAVWVLPTWAYYSESNGADVPQLSTDWPTVISLNAVDDPGASPIFLTMPGIAVAANAVDEFGNSSSEPGSFLGGLLVYSSSDVPRRIAVAASVTTESDAVFPRFGQEPDFSQLPGLTNGPTASVSAAGIVVLESGMSSLEQGPDFRQRSRTICNSHQDCYSVSRSEVRAIII
jgi:hypothetical protein